jgi:hypothetical protein
MKPGVGQGVQNTFTHEQTRRLVRLRTELDSWGKPLGDLDALRYLIDELLAILLEQPGETSKKKT